MAGNNGVAVREGVVYGTGGGRDLKCDLYLPAEKPGGRAGLLLVHGGGWRGGDRAMMRGFALRLVAEGFVCVAPEYRLTPESAWPAQIHDVKAAIRWFRANAGDLGVDPARIALQGSSAGAHLVLLAAGTAGRAEFSGSGGNPGVEESVAAVVAIYPPTVFYVGEQRARGGTHARALIGEAATAEQARAASPVHHIGSGFPPALLLHGTDDKVVPPSASMVMYEALVSAGIPAEMHLYAQQPHGFARQPAFEPLCCAEIAHFLGRYLNPVAAAAPVAAGN